MGRLRRRVSLSAAPVAAEILEERSLLSAGVALAHQVEPQVHSAPNQVATPAKAPPDLFDGAVKCQLVVNNVPILQFPGLMSLSPVPLKPGSHVTGLAQGSGSSNGLTFRFSDAIKGKVISSAPSGQDTRVVLKAGGLVTETVSDQNGHTKILKIKPTSDQMIILLDSQGQFVGLKATYQEHSSKHGPRTTPFDLIFSS